MTFAIFFGGIVGPNAASGTIPAMFAYVLPVVSAGGAATIPDRLEGWWMASVAGTIAVLLFSPPAPGNRLRAATAELAGELAGRLRAAADGQATTPAAMRAAKERLRAAFDAAPYRPTGLATADQALGSLVQLLEWGATQVGDAFDGHIDLVHSCPEDRALLRAAAGAVRRYAGAAGRPGGRARFRRAGEGAGGVRGATARPVRPRRRAGRAGRGRAGGARAVDRGRRPRRRRRRADRQPPRHRRGGRGRAARLVRLLGRRRHRGRGPGRDHARERRARRRRAGRGGQLAPGAGPDRRGHLGAAARVRPLGLVPQLAAGAVALAAAVAVADASGVQHAFWVVLGTLSVLRTSAAATGSTALRALGGTVVGFVIGAALLIGIGTNPDALWAVFPVAVFVAAYAPGTTPFLVGQAAFTVTIVVLFNLLAPVGWTIGLLRVEDVAIGCGVSLAVGVLVWPRGVSSVVGDDLADAFRSGAAFLTQAVDWALSELMVPPAASIAAVSAGIRLDDAVRGFLTEQGSKKLGKDDLWAMVNAATRLRLTANTLAALRPAGAGRPRRRRRPRQRLPAAGGVGRVRGRARLHQSPARGIGAGRVLRNDRPGDRPADPRADDGFAAAGAGAGGAEAGVNGRRGRAERRVAGT